MNRVLSLYHFTTKENLEKILKDGYLRPYESVMGKGVFLIANMDKNLLQKRKQITMFGNYVIELDKRILEDRKDFYIREAFNEYNFELYGGKIVFNMKDGNKKKLNKILKKLTLVNEVIFCKKISMNKYLKNIYKVELGKKINNTKLVKIK
jgi:hypothetical protein